MPRRDPPPENFEQAVQYLESQGFKCKRLQYGPKTRCDLAWPDDRRGIRLPEWRVVEIAEGWKTDNHAGAGTAQPVGNP